jgi:RNA polymerase sigma-70 factor (ECF subfamily)
MISGAALFVAVGAAWSKRLCSPRIPLSYAHATVSLLDMAAPQTESFLDLLAKLRSRDPTAAERLERDYARRLIGLARERLGERLGSKVEPTEVVQSVFLTFLEHMGEGAWDLPDQDHLWQLLAKITARKCDRRIRFFGTQKRDTAAEQSLEAASEGDSSFTFQPAGTEPTPEEVAIFTDLVDSLLAGGTSDEQLIVQMRLEGHEVQDIAKVAGLSERTVHRKLSILRKRLTYLCGDPDD